MFLGGRSYLYDEVGHNIFHTRKATLSWLHVSFHKLGCSLKFNGNVQVFELSKGNKAITDQQ